MPGGATNKCDKEMLRTGKGGATGLVNRRPPRPETLGTFAPADAETLRHEFEDNQRMNLLQ